MYFNSIGTFGFAVNAGMSFKINLAVEPFVTGATSVFVVLSMSQNMAFEGGKMTITFGTVRALERPFL